MRMPARFPSHGGRSASVVLALPPLRSFRDASCVSASSAQVRSLLHTTTRPFAHGFVIQNVGSGDAFVSVSCAASSRQIAFFFDGMRGERSTWKSRMPQSPLMDTAMPLELLEPSGRFRLQVEDVFFRPCDTIVPRIALHIVVSRRARSERNAMRAQTTLVRRRYTLFVCAKLARPFLATP
jgi:hypothetical protein